MHGSTTRDISTISVYYVNLYYRKYHLLQMWVGLLISFVRFTCLLFPTKTWNLHQRMVSLLFLLLFRFSSKSRVIWLIFIPFLIQDSVCTFVHLVSTSLYRNRSRTVQQYYIWTNQSVTMALAQSGNLLFLPLSLSKLSLGGGFSKVVAKLSSFFVSVFIWSFRTLCVFCIQFTFLICVRCARFLFRFVKTKIRRNIFLLNEAKELCNCLVMVTCIFFFIRSSWNIFYFIWNIETCVFCVKTWFRKFFKTK